MAKVLKVVKKPVRALGEYLQAKADKMFARKQFDEEYTKTRKSAEWHLRMWAWQKTTPAWKLPGKEEEEHRAIACKKVKCPHLPAGSEQCRNGTCP
jgi:hypothetical protein